MSNAPTTPPAAWDEEPPSLVRWRSWPLYDNPLWAALVVAGLIAAGVVAFRATDRTHLAVLAVAALVVALWRFFLPVMYELNADGVNQWLFGRHRRIPWSEIRRYEVTPTGILLLPRTDPCAMDVFRGEFIPWGNHREKIMAQIRYFLEPPDESSL